jgi:integrase
VACEALRWEDVDLVEAVIRVRASWDPKAGRVAPKSKAGRRAVPIASILHAHLAELRAGAHNAPSSWMPTCAVIGQAKAAD